MMYVHYCSFDDVWVAWYYLPPLKELPSLNMAELSNFWKLKWKYIFKIKLNHSPQDLSSPHQTGWKTL